jgi:carnitine O-acetyltransferase
LREPAVDAQIRNVATGIDGGRNRWFDKAISVTIENTGRGGIMGEHSPVDALIPSIAVEYVLGEPVDESKFTSTSSSAAESSSGKGWECQGRNRKLIEDSDASQLWWGEYGVEWIKKHGEGPSLISQPVGIG